MLIREIGSVNVGFVSSSEFEENGRIWRKGITIGFKERCFCIRASGNSSDMDLLPYCMSKADTNCRKSILQKKRLAMTFPIFVVTSGEYWHSTAEQHSKHTFLTLCIYI